MNIEKIWNSWSDAKDFSGVFTVSNEEGLIFEKCCGYRNRSENLLNNIDTAFGIASGTKMLTGLAVCKLIDDNKLSLESKLCDVLHYDLGQIDKRVTIFHLLTHTSGIGDYIDEESSNCEEQLQALYENYPVYMWEHLEYYLPMITPLPPKFEPGERYAYSNAGFVLLGLAVESVSGVSFQQFVKDIIIEPCRLIHTGFYRMDALPANTAYGYTKDDETSDWYSNIFGLPIIGGSDGGLFTCSEDIKRLWRAVAANKILSEKMTQAFFMSQVTRYDDEYYGLGVYCKGNSDNLVYYAVGGDCGIDFFTAYFPKQKIVATALGNTEIDTYSLLEAIIQHVVIFKGEEDANN